MSQRIGNAALALLLLASARAFGGEGREAAREHFQKGTTQYTLNHYDEAIREFEAGYAAEPEPAFLFNLGQAHARLGHTRLAIDFYRKYIELGAGDDAAQVREMVDRLAHDLEAEKAPPTVIAPAKPAPSPVLDVTAPPPSPPKRTWAIGVGVAAAVIVVALVVGLAFGLTQEREPSALWSVH